MNRLDNRGISPLMAGLLPQIPRCDLLSYVRRKAVVGMSSEQIASDYADYYNISFDHAKKLMGEADYREAIEAGRQAGLGKIWETLYGLAVEKKDAGLLVLLAKEQLKVFGQVTNDDPMIKSSLSQDKLKKIHELVFG
jgi:hypothetical protein